MKWRVLIADDDDDVRLLLRVMLSREPEFEVVGEAATPDDALVLARELQPDAAVIDHEFRGHMTGLDLAPSLREAAPDMKVVMFSAHDWLRSQVRDSTATDAFVLKTDVHLLSGLLQTLLTT